MLPLFLSPTKSGVSQGRFAIACLRRAFPLSNAVLRSKSLQNLWEPAYFSQGSRPLRPERVPKYLWVLWRAKKSPKNRGTVRRQTGKSSESVWKVSPDYPETLWRLFRGSWRHFRDLSISDPEARETPVRGGLVMGRVLVAPHLPILARNSCISVSHDFIETD